MIPPKNFHSKFFFEIQVWFVFIEIILHIVIWYYIVQIYPLYVCILLSGQPNSHWLLLVLCLVLLLYFINSFVHFSCVHLQFTGIYPEEDLLDHRRFISTISLSNFKMTCCTNVYSSHQCLFVSLQTTKKIIDIVIF